jgi:hypothetical protein
VLLALNLAAASDSTQSIVQNGSFEQVTYVPLALDPWVLPNWQALLGNWDNAPDGGNYILVNTLYQDLSTTPGQSYALSFDVAADRYSEPSAHVDVLWGGQIVATAVTQPHAYDPQQNRYEQAVWELFSTPVTAMGSTTRLEFESGDGFAYLFDNVRVIPVPEPSPASLLMAASLLLLAQASWKRLAAKPVSRPVGGSRPAS